MVVAPAPTVSSSVVGGARTRGPVPNDSKCLKARLGGVKKGGIKFSSSEDKAAALRTLAKEITSSSTSSTTSTLMEVSPVDDSVLAPLAYSKEREDLAQMAAELNSAFFKPVHMHSGLESGSGSDSEIIPPSQEDSQGRSEFLKPKSQGGDTRRKRKVKKRLKDSASKQSESDSGLVSKKAKDGGPSSIPQDGKGKGSGTKGAPQDPRVKPARPSLPPVVITKVSSFTAVQNIIHTATGGKFECRARGTSIVLTTKTEEGLVKLKQALTDNKVGFHTYGKEEEKPVQLVIYGLHPSVQEADIMSDLRSQGYTATHVHRFTQTSKKGVVIKQNSVGVSLRPGGPDPMLITVVCYHKVRVEYKRPGKVTVCMRCSSWDHTANHCSHAPKCGLCGGPHAHRDHPKEVPLKCPSCGLGHGINSPQCAVLQAKAAKKARLQANANPQATSGQGKLPTPPPPPGSAWPSLAKGPTPTPTNPTPKPSTSFANVVSRAQGGEGNKGHQGGASTKNPTPVKPQGLGLQGILSEVIAELKTAITQLVHELVRELREEFKNNLRGQLCSIQ